VAQMPASRVEDEGRRGIREDGKYREIIAIRYIYMILPIVETRVCDVVDGCINGADAHKAKRRLRG
jgi:hypothetical protein